MKVSRWIIWMGIIAATLITGFVILIVSLPKSKTYTPTGDPLFDRYALLVLDGTTDSTALERFLNFKRNRGLSAYMEQVDFGVIATWQDEFGDRPDYWELRFQFDQDQSILLEAIDHAPASYSLYSALDLHKMAKSAPQQALDLTNQAIQMNPDNSYYYYQKANLLIMLGEFSEARQALQAGNSARTNEHPKFYCWRMVEEHLLDADDPESIAVAGYSLETTPVPFCLHIREASPLVLEAVAQGEDREFLNEWITYNRRLAQMDGTSLYEIMVAIGAEFRIHTEAPAQLGLSSAELTDIQIADLKLNEINDCISQLSRGKPPKLSLRSMLYPHTIMLDSYAHLINKIESLPQIQQKFAELDPPPFAPSE